MCGFFVTQCFSSVLAYLHVTKIQLAGTSFIPAYGPFNSFILIPTILIFELIVLKIITKTYIKKLLIYRKTIKVGIFIQNGLFKEYLVISTRKIISIFSCLYHCQYFYSSASSAHFPQNMMISCLTYIIVLFRYCGKCETAISSYLCIQYS